MQCCLAVSVGRSGERILSLLRFICFCTGTRLADTQPGAQLFPTLNPDSCACANISTLLPTSVPVCSTRVA